MTLANAEDHGVEPVAIPVEEDSGPTVSHEVEATQEAEGDPVNPEIPTTEPVVETSVDEDEPEVSTDLADHPPLSRQIWEAVGKNSVSLAYHATRHFNVPSPNVTALRFALLGRNIMNAESDLLDAFIHDLEEDPDVESWDTADAVLGFSGLFPAALADPRIASLALSAIQRLNLPSELHRFRTELTKLVNDLHGHSFFEELDLAKTYLRWLGEEERFKRSLDEELRTAPSRTMSYAPATKVWQSFWHPDGVLHRLVAPAAESVRGPVKARSMLPDEIDRLIQDTYRSHDSRRRDTIHTSALRQLQMKVEEALGLVQEFSAHRASEPVIDRHVRGVVDFVRQWHDLRPDIVAGIGL